MQAFHAGALEGFLLDYCSDLVDGLKILPQRGTVVQLHRLLARGAIHEGEDNSRRGPLIYDNLLNAFNVEHVPTTEFDARFGAEATDPADGAVSILICIIE